jgi:hypothetical protein
MCGLIKINEIKKIINVQESMQLDYIRDVEKRWKNHIEKYGVTIENNPKIIKATREQNLE